MSDEPWFAPMMAGLPLCCVGGLRKIQVDVAFVLRQDFWTTCVWWVWLFSNAEHRFGYLHGAEPRFRAETFHSTNLVSVADALR